MAAQRAVDAGIKVVAFDVNVENEAIPQIEQSDYLLASSPSSRPSRITARSGMQAMSTSPASRRSTVGMKAWEDIKEGQPRHPRGRPDGHARQPDRERERQPGAVGAIRPTSRSASSSRPTTNSPRA